jgi:cysteine desulfurase/selenocysteine lyase
MNAELLKSKFPIFKQPSPLGQELIYLDSASSAQKPQVVIDAISSFYAGFYANTGRGSYWPASAATQAVQEVRAQVAQLINATSKDEIVFTAGTTDAINKLARVHFMPLINSGDQIIVSEMEHHANLIPWQELAKTTGAIIKAIPIDEDGKLDLAAYQELLKNKTALVAVTATSNVLGTITPVAELSSLAHQAGALIFVDGAQSIAHALTDVQSWDCDFLAFSGHKLYGPTGIGILYGKKELLDAMEPLSYGGGMIRRVAIDQANYLRKSPHKHEAGTMNIAGIVGLGAAIDFVQDIGLGEIERALHDLTQYGLVRLGSVEGLSIKGGVERAPVISFTLENIHPHDLSTFLNEKGICVRAGHHCAQPLMSQLKVHATTRASFGLYNTRADVDALVKTIEEAKDFFG